MLISPSVVSRAIVGVTLRVSTSTSPDCSAVKRACVVNGVRRNLLASLKTVAAMARHMSTSSPCQLPLLSGEEKPWMPVDTPHCT
ncbi:hypothetical protein ACH58_08975 [Achromobacter xylosoxidans]|nr:hypothetical protein ACH58_08975 [Achromobacter xylosoxidans]